MCVAPASLTLQCRKSSRLVLTTGSNVKESRFGNTLACGLRDLAARPYKNHNGQMPLKRDWAVKALDIPAPDPLADLPGRAPPFASACLVLTASYRFPDDGKPSCAEGALGETESSASPSWHAFGRLPRAGRTGRLSAAACPQFIGIYPGPPAGCEEIMEARASDGRDPPRPPHPRVGHRDRNTEKSGERGPVDKRTKRGRSEKDDNASQKSPPKSEGRKRKGF